MDMQRFRYIQTDEKTIERVVQDDTLHINHMILPHGEGFPEHTANAQVYMTVLRGRLTLYLNGTQTDGYTAGDILKISRGTVMQGWNEHAETLELLIVKQFAK